MILSIRSNKTPMVMDTRILHLAFLLSLVVGAVICVQENEEIQTLPNDSSRKSAVDEIMEVNSKSNVSDKLIEGDIMPDPRRNYGNDPSGDEKRGARTGRDAKWPLVNGVRQVPYVIEYSSRPDAGKILRVMNYWMYHVPCVKFVPRSNQRDYISFHRGAGCTSYVGRIGRGRQRISLASHCTSFPVITHEIGHALGFYHEQSRPDRDRYVVILRNNIKSGYQGAFNIYPDIDSRGVPYDYNSLMHYGPKAFSKDPNRLYTILRRNGSPNVGQARSLSASDIEQAKRMLCPGTHVCKRLYKNKESLYRCNRKAAHGFCEKNPETMNYKCSQSCICRTCLKDKDPECAALGRKGHCTSSNPDNRAWMEFFCAETCKLCPPWIQGF